MTIQKVTQSSISYTLENPTGKEYGFGGDCGPFLYVYKNESWEYAEPIVDSWTCTALMYTIMPHSEINRTYNYHIWLGELPKGYYKFQKEIYDLSANETIILEQKFSIS